jgi:phage-related protein
MTRQTRPISWIKAARRDFEKFPEAAQAVCLTALTIAAEGGKADIAKPFKGLGSGIFEIALPFRGNAYRLVYCLYLGEELWVLHAFQKKSTQGVKTPRREVELIESRLKLLKELLG